MAQRLQAIYRQMQPQRLAFRSDDYVRELLGQMTNTSAAMDRLNVQYMLGIQQVY
jgi:hypothetical protein